MNTFAFVRVGYNDRLTPIVFTSALELHPYRTTREYNKYTFFMVWGRCFRMLIPLKHVE